MKPTLKQMPERSLLASQHDQVAQTTAFTLIELLVVICVIALLAATLAPTLAGSRIGSESFRCQNNNRQLCSAWRMYADDNNDRIVYAADDGTPAGTSYAWTKIHMDYSTSNV